MEVVTLIYCGQLCNNAVNSPSTPLTEHSSLILASGFICRQGQECFNHVSHNWATLFTLLTKVNRDLLTMHKVRIHWCLNPCKPCDDTHACSFIMSSCFWVCWEPFNQSAYSQQRPRLGSMQIIQCISINKSYMYLLTKPFKNLTSYGTFLKWSRSQLVEFWHCFTPLWTHVLLWNHWLKY
jgi:hypothetical protein